MDSGFYTLQRCLENICKVIRKANDVLCGISHPSVCSEVLLSAQGKSYFSGMFTVYKVSKRVEGGMRTLGFTNEALQRSIKDIELLWNNLQAFLTFSPAVLQTLVASDKDILSYNECRYHTSCANFWLNFVDLNLPFTPAQKQG
ncbi:synergin gamma-like [Acipenser oxyrinchus oxyrinchus]|uniref:Synergin gamma-like n=1 Tax=Acipenser oxyrinchus oxyrinchus TaxID=40147 RepID=A0AAD8FQF9_ACIOX|nr:synergin gamma-like [Acipenser oxyrinchus oxyrinchus]